MTSRLIAAILVASSPAWAGEGVAKGPDFDQGALNVAQIVRQAQAVAKRASAVKAKGVAKGGTEWVSIGASDVSLLEDSAFPLGAPAAKNGRAAIFEMPDELLPLLSQFMHEKSNRCGGFFAHRTKSEAEKDLAPAPKAAGASYTIDQQSWVRPLMPLVKESEIRSTIEKLASYNNRYYTADTGVEAAKWLQSRWQELAANLPGAKAELVSHDGWPQPSVVLTIPGSEKPDEIVVLGGHLDSINGWGSEEARAPGADDNASGIATITEALRVLADANFKPKRTVQFMGYAAEEVGLRGSADIAQRYAQAGKKVIGVVQYDMTGFKGSDQEIFLLTDNVDPTLTDFMGRLIDTYVGVARSTTECGYACSDHASWTQNGYPSALPFEASFDGMNHALHTERDTLSTIGGTAEHVVPFAKLAIAFASELAKTPQSARLARTSVVGAGVSGSK